MLNSSVTFFQYHNSLLVMKVKSLSNVIKPVQQYRQSF